MTRHRRCRSASCLILAAFLAPLASAGAQATARHAARVFVQPLETEDSSRSTIEFAQYLAQAVRYGLLQSLRVAVVAGRAPTCERTVVQSGRAGDDPSAPDLADWIVVHGRLARVESDSAFALDLAADRCVRGTRTRVADEHRTFPARSASSHVNALVSLLGDYVGTALLPKLRLVVEGMDGEVVRSSSRAPAYAKSQGSGAARPSTASVWRLLASEIAQTGAFEVVEGEAEYLLHARLIATSVATTDTVRFVLSQAGDTSRSLSLQSWRNPDEPRLDFWRRFARLASERARAFLHSPELGATGRLSDLPRDSLLRRARRALCLDVTGGCAPDGEAATAAVLAMGAGVFANPDALVVLSRAELARGGTGRALSLLQAAARQLERGAAVTTAEASQGAVLVAIGDIFREAGSGDSATASYRAAIRAGVPAQSLAHRLVESLRMADRKVEALSQAATALRRTQGDDAMLALARATLKEIPRARLLADSSIIVVGACTAHATLERECGTTYAAAAERSARDPRNTTSTRALARLGLTLRGLQPVAAADLAAAAAASYLEPVVYERGPDGALRATSSLHVADSVAHYLGLAQRAPVDSLTQATRAWIGRATALDQAVRGDLPGALRTLERTHAEIGVTRSGAVLHGELAIAHATQLRIRGSAEPARASALSDSVRVLMGGARAVVDRANAAFPRDPFLLRVRGQICGEYAIDRACAFETNRTLLHAGQLRHPRQLLDAVESAMFADSIPVGLAWLKRIDRPDALSGCDQALVGFFGYWGAAQSGGDGSESFGRYLRGVTRHRAANGGLCWMFGGARSRLAAEPRPRDAARLQTMVEALDSRDAPLPTSPTAGPEAGRPVP